MNLYYVYDLKVGSWRKTEPASQEILGWSYSSYLDATVKQMCYNNVRSRIENKNMFRSKCLLLLLSLLNYASGKLKWKSEDEASGIVLLDSATFPKIVPHSRAAVLVGIFDKITIGTGKKADNIRDEFLNFAIEGERGGRMDDLLVAQIIVNGLV